MVSISYKVLQEDKGKRLDIFLAEKIKINRSGIKKLIEKGLVLLNNELPKKAGQSVKIGDNIEILEEIHEVSEDYSKKIKIIKDTDDYVVINKPSGLLVHPTNRGEANTLADWIIKNYPNVKGVGESSERPGIVHRLDKEASGVMVIAKNQGMFFLLKKQFQNKEIDKEYSILVHGIPKKNHDEINFEISRGVNGKMTAKPKIDKLRVKNVGKEQVGRGALTEFWVEKKFSRFALLKVKIHTGRTHQIRVHMLAYNHPVVGDSLHFNKKLNRKRDKKLGRIFLHARRICFNDLKNESVCYNSDLPKELNDFIKEIK